MRHYLDPSLASAHLGPATSLLPGVHRALDVLKDFAPGSQLPILLSDGDVKTDTLQIEEFLEEMLGPPE